MSRGTVDLQSLGIFIHTDAQEMRASKAAEHGLRLPYEKAVSRDTMRVSPLGIHPRGCVGGGCARIRGTAERGPLLLYNESMSSACKRLAYLPTRMRIGDALLGGRGAWAQAAI